MIETRKLIYFGPGRDSTALTTAVNEILGSTIVRADGENERIFRRTSNKLNFRTPRGVLGIIGIASTNPNTREAKKFPDRQLTTGDNEFAPVRTVIQGIIGYVSDSALEPNEIATDLQNRLQITQDGPAPTAEQYANNSVLHISTAATMGAKKSATSLREPMTEAA